MQLWVRVIIFNIIGLYNFSFKSRDILLMQHILICFIITFKLLWATIRWDLLQKHQHLGAAHYL